MSNLPSNVEYDREFGWNDEIENDEVRSFVLLDPGEYDYVVNTFERGRHNGSAKLPACNKAILHVCILSDLGNVEINHNLFLHSKTEGFLCKFFRSIGMRKHGERLRMNWNAVPGATGRCKVGIRKWKGKDGSERKSNEILEFLDPPEQETQPPQPAGFTPGAF